MPAEVRESKSALLRTDVSSSVAANAGIAKGEISSSLEAQQSSGAQVVRKALVQSTFKELFDLEAPSLPMRSGHPSGDPPEPTDGAALLELARSHGDPWVIPAKALDRGTLLELEVELEAEGIFRMSTIMATFFEIADQNPKFLGAASVTNLLDSFMVNQMLERLMVGLVPIRGRALDYRCVRVDEEDLIVHRAVLKQIEGAGALTVHPLVVVGVAERELFWRDIRRVLFSRSRYSVLCRLTRNGIQSSWTPVKLVDVLKEVAPELGTSIQEAGSFLDVQHGGAGEEADAQAGELAMRRALSSYAIDLARQYGHDLSSSDLAALDLLSDDQYKGFAEREKRRDAFRQVGKVIGEHFGFEADPLTVAQLRSAALEDAGFDIDGKPPGAISTKGEVGEQKTEARYLDTNIVGIYW